MSIYNNTQNNSLPNPIVRMPNYIIESATLKIGLTTCFALAICASLVGNILVIAVVYKNINGRMRNASNTFIMNMCIADLFVTVWNLPRMITKIYIGFEIPFGTETVRMIICKIANVVPHVPITVSLETFMFIAIDRFAAVIFQFKKPFSQKGTIYKTLAIIWILPLAIYSIFIYMSEVTTDQSGKNICVINVLKIFTSVRAYMNFAWVDFALITCLPFATTIMLYSAIIMKLSRRNIPGHTLACYSMRRDRENRNVVKMLIAVEAVFIFAWLPLWIGSIGCSVDSTLSICHSSFYFYVQYFTAYSSGAVTPFVYPIFCKSYRFGFQQILKNCCCQGKTRRGYPEDPVSSLNIRNYRRTRRSTDSLYTAQVPTLFNFELGNINEGMK